MVMSSSTPGPSSMKAPPRHQPGHFFEPRSNYNYSWQFEQRVHTHAALKEMFLSSDMRMPEFIGFMSTLQQQRLIVEQLRREAAIKRINVSQAVEDIKKYVMDHQREDCLVYGFHPPHANRWKDKSPCTVL